MPFMGVCLYTCVWRPEEDGRCYPPTLFTLVAETWFFTKSEAHTILGFMGRTTQGLSSLTQCLLVFMCVRCRPVVSSYLLSMHTHSLIHGLSLRPLLRPSSSPQGSSTWKGCFSSEIQPRQKTRILSKSWLPTSLPTQPDSDFK